MTAQESPALTTDQIRQLLRECVTVVKPGEVLILRMGNDYTPNQLRALQEALNWVSPEGEAGLPFRTLVVPGEDLGVAQLPESGSDG